MRHLYRLLKICLIVGLASLLLVACSNKNEADQEQKAQAEKKPSLEQQMKKGGAAVDHAKLPVRYQQTAYIAAATEADKELGTEADQVAIKVGANIVSTRGPQPLWDIMKRLAHLKGMNVSWASDVNRDVKVDVNIRADDNFFDAIDNLLRQVDYFHEVVGKTIIVRYRETKNFHINFPDVHGHYNAVVMGGYRDPGIPENGDPTGMRIRATESNGLCTRRR